MADQNAGQPSKTKSDVKKLRSKGLSKNDYFENQYSVSSTEAVFWYCHSHVTSSINKRVKTHLYLLVNVQGTRRYKGLEQEHEGASQVRLRL